MLLTLVILEVQLNIIKYDDDDYFNYIQIGNKPIDLDVNPKTNKVYVANYDSDTLSVINSTNGVEEIPVGNKPISVAVNPNTNKIYVTQSRFK